MDVLSVGDMVTDAFIKLVDTNAHTYSNENGLWLAMPFGKKVPFDHAEVIEGVGNSANAAVSFARLGLNSGLNANVGDDQFGRDMILALKKNGVDSRYVHINPGKKSNYHYVLWYKEERTILINNEQYEYDWPHIRKADMPNMVVLAPCDSVEAEKMTLAMAKDPRPNYMRLAREATPVFTTEETPFEIGKAYIFDEGKDVTIIATGTMTYQALVAAEKLYKDGIEAEVVHVGTIKPLDGETILKSVKKTGAVVTVEEAQINGGLGGAIAELLIEKLPVPMLRIGMKDQFGESGKPEELLEHFGLNAKQIALAAHHVISKKS